jgi:DNA repair protein RadD
MTYELRDYQKDAVKSALNYFRSDKEKSVIEVLPTGAGKSLVIANIAKELNEPVLIFQPTKEILEQNYSKLLSYGITDCSIFSASFNSKEISNLTFATIGSVKSKPEAFSHFKNIIVDECHYVNSKGGMYKEFFDVVGEKMVGLTATPYRLAGNSFGSILRFLTRTKPRIFSEVIYQVQIAELFEQGFLTKLEYHQVNGFDSNRLTINSTGADYTDESVKRYYEEIQFKNRTVDIVNRLLNINRKNILIFTRFTDEAQTIVNQLGDVAQIVTAETKMKDRTEIINNFKNGKIKVVANVGVLTHGFDFPELETVVLARPTRSLALYYQMIGRGIRIHEQKQYSMIVDLCQNYNRFGKIEDLKLVEPKKNLWHVESNGRQLTNVYFN